MNRNFTFLGDVRQDQDGFAVIAAIKFLRLQFIRGFFSGIENIIDAHSGAGILGHEAKQFAPIFIVTGLDDLLLRNITDEVMELKMKSQIGSMDEEIVIEKEGKDLLIGFNPKFLIDALKVIDDEEIDVYMVNPKAPCFIRDAGENYIYLILPVNFTTVS